MSGVTAQLKQTTVKHHCVKRSVFNIRHTMCSIETHTYIYVCIEAAKQLWQLKLHAGMKVKSHIKMNEPCQYLSSLIIWKSSEQLASLGIDKKVTVFTQVSSNTPLVCHWSHSRPMLLLPGWSRCSNKQYFESTTEPNIYTF